MGHGPWALRLSCLLPLLLCCLLFLNPEKSPDSSLPCLQPCPASHAIGQARPVSFATTFSVAADPRRSQPTGRSIPKREAEKSQEPLRTVPGGVWRALGPGRGRRLGRDWGRGRGGLRGRRGAARARREQGPGWGQATSGRLRRW